MQKVFYLLFDDENADGTRLRQSISERVVPVLRGSGAKDISLFVSDDDVAKGSPTRQSDPPICAALSFWLPEIDDRVAIETTLEDLVPRIVGLLVLESRPMDHERRVGQRTPGMTQVTCITRREDISFDEFIRIWHEDHAKVAIETQSTFGYVRNEIVRPLTEGAPEHWSAIVEESFPIEALDDPMIFFDARSKSELGENVKRMVASCRRFLDLERIEVTFTSEYYFG